MTTKQMYALRDKIRETHKAVITHEIVKTEWYVGDPVFKMKGDPEQFLAVARALLASLRKPCDHCGGKGKVPYLGEPPPWIVSCPVCAELDELLGVTN